MNKRILLLGGGGHCESVLDSLVGLGTYAEIGIIDNEKSLGSGVAGVFVVGCDDDLPALYAAGYGSAFVTIGSIGDTGPRNKVFKLLKKLGFETPNIIDPTAVVGQNVELGTGVYIGKNAVVNAGAKVGSGVIINTGAIVEHGSTIGDFAHLATGAVLCGQVSVGERTHIGAGCVVRQGITIGHDTTIGMGSVVLEDIGDHLVAYGNPCKAVRKK